MDLIRVEEVQLVEEFGEKVECPRTEHLTRVDGDDEDVDREVGDLDLMEFTCRHVWARGGG
jgi:hypothetical protein